MSDPKEAPQSGLIRLFNSLKLFPKPEDIANAVNKLRAVHPSVSACDLARKIVNSATWRLTGAGVVASLPSAIPGLGTVIQIGVTTTSITGETWLILRNLTAMQWMVAGITGHDVFEPERQDELIIVWGIETGVIVPAKEAIKRVGTKVAIKQFNKRVSGNLLKRINQKLGTTVVTKWGTKRGGIALGRLIPLGVGSAVGGGMNYLTARSFGAACLKYYCDILPNNEEVIILE
ncbi:MAG: hypothetical protein E3J21_14875 [Anaerolineales bacterium]|nr:MAG: hypothetical protein E3J21_14875 [Anaerolineales bacterium]